jgi:hypothetical protein
VSGTLFGLVRYAEGLVQREELLGQAVLPIDQAHRHLLWADDRDRLREEDPWKFGFFLLDQNLQFPLVGLMKLHL